MTDPSSARLNRLRGAAFAGVLFWVFACGGSSDDQRPRVGALPDGERILYVSVTSNKKALMELRSNGRREVPFQKDVDSSFSGGEKLVALDDGGLIYCGVVDDNVLLDACWIQREGKVSRVGPPVLGPPGETTTYNLHLERDGRWWRSQTELRVGASLETPAQTVPLPFEGRPSEVALASGNRLAATHRADHQTTLWMIDGDEQVEIAIQGFADALSFHPNGRDLAFVDERGVVVWREGTSKVVIPRALGPDQRPEYLHLAAWSPDGTRLLIQSSRHLAQSYNPCAGVYNAHPDPYIVDLTTGEWTRLPTLGLAVSWLSSAP